MKPLQLLYPDMPPSVTCELDKHQVSADGWLFRVPLKDGDTAPAAFRCDENCLKNLNFLPNYYGSENLAIHYIRKHGATVASFCFDLIVYHRHFPHVKPSSGKELNAGPNFRIDLSQCGSIVCVDTPYYGGTDRTRYLP